MDRRFLVVDAHESRRICFRDALRRPGWSVDTAADGTSALEMLVEGDYSLAVVDLDLPGLDGLDLVREVQAKDVPTTILIVADDGPVESIVEAIKLGAYDCLAAPVDVDYLRARVENALRDRALRDEVERRRREGRKWWARAIVGKSRAMAPVFHLIDRIAPGEEPVLILGESGTGKNLVAQAIHAAGREGDLEVVPCGALSETLFESELFGHELGAYTGAHRQRKGRFEAASGRTLLLDEIGELKPEMQAKLLRVLAEKTFERVGGAEPVPLTARILCTSNRDLEALVRDGAFREDLYYRLKIATIAVPPLRDRLDDLPLMVEHILDKLAEDGLPRKRIASAALARLGRYDWPGNVRELERVLTQVCFYTPGAIITPDNLAGLIDLPQDDAFALDFDFERPLSDIIDQLTERIEKAYLKQVLEKYHGKIHECARHCGLSRRSISEKLRRYQIDKWDFKPNRHRRRNVPAKE